MADVNRKKISKKRILLERLLLFCGVLVIWKCLTLRFPPMVVPEVGTVIGKIADILSDPESWNVILVTARRLAAGLLLGILSGAAAGLVMGMWCTAERLLSPLIRILQTVPPVCWVMLALVWFGFNDKPCVFIVILTTLPPVAVNLAQGVRQMDRKLIEMGQMYHFTKKDKFLHIILPSIMPYIYSALEIVVSGGWKIAVMAEVLTISTGIGGEINMARLNIEPETMMAWAAVMVLLCYFTQWLLTVLFLRRGRKIR